MGWTTVTCPERVATQFDCTPYIVLEGSPSETLGYVNNNCIPVVHDAVSYNSHDTYQQALEYMFMTETQGAAIGNPIETLDIPTELLTVVLAHKL